MMMGKSGTDGEMWVPADAWDGRGEREADAHVRLCDFV